MKNFQILRPSSNSKFVSKLTEKDVAWQLNDHILNQYLYEKFQSAYRKFHSAESTLLRVQNVIQTALDNNKSVILLLLDVSAAYDTVDHDIPFLRLSTRFGVKELY